MIKSNRDMTEIINLKTMNNFEVRGKVCIDLTDPLTGKVKDRVAGNNHIFIDALMSGENFDWVTSLTNSVYSMNDSSEPLDVSYPYLRGKTIAYGRANLGTLGVTRGAYNANNQVLAAMSLTKANWKFQYDFTTAQANNGTIRNVGLTNQYLDKRSKFLKGYKPTGVCKNGISKTNDGKYVYDCSVDGILNKTNILTGEVQSIDVSVHCTDKVTAKNIGYAPATGKYYIYQSVNTPESRRMLQFADNTFSAVDKVIHTTKVLYTFNPSNHYPIYIHGNNAYIFDSNIRICKFSTMEDNPYTEIKAPTQDGNRVYINENPGTSSDYVAYANGTVPFGAEGLIAIGSNYNYITKGCIFNMNNDTFDTWFRLTAPSNSDNFPNIVNPINPSVRIICNSGIDGALHHSSAISTYILPTPVTKTNAFGMTATYEIEVLW